MKKHRKSELEKTNNMFQERKSFKRNTRKIISEMKIEVERTRDHTML